MTNKQAIFEAFTNSFGQLMTTGLNDLNPAMKKHVTEAFEKGGQIFTIVTPEPVSISAMLKYGDNQPHLELFVIQNATAGKLN